VESDRWPIPDRTVAITGLERNRLVRRSFRVGERRERNAERPRRKIAAVEVLHRDIAGKRADSQAIGTGRKIDAGIRAGAGAKPDPAADRSKSEG
jgi:hypothetical protein